jgi:thiamine monophosphate synthase
VEEAQLATGAARWTRWRPRRQSPNGRVPTPRIGGLHVVVSGLEAARDAVLAGADVLRLTTDEGSPAARAAGRGLRDLGTWFYVVDDLAVALELGADGVHLDRRQDLLEPARAAGLRVGLTLPGAAPDGLDYVELGWAGERGGDRPSRSWLLELSLAVAGSSVPVVAGARIDAVDVQACLDAGAAGIAVRDALTARELRRALDDWRPAPPAPGGQR